MNRVTILIMATSLLALAAPGASANPDHPRGPHGKPGPEAPGPGGAPIRHLVGALRQLDLSEDQREQVRAVVESSSGALHANHRAAADHRDRLRELLMDEGLDEAALAAIARAEGELAERRVLLTARAVADILAVLDDEQRARLYAMGEERRAWRRAWRGGGEG